MSAAQFVLDPTAFMRRNIILTDVVSSQEANPGNTAVRRFTLVPYGVPVTNLDGAAVYRLNDLPLTGPVAADHLIAYWCPYRADHQLGAMLQNDAQYMFTAVMDGCSLGIGSPTSDGSRAVFHANMESAAGPKDGRNPKSVEKAIGRQVEEQKKKLLHMFVPEQNIVDPAFYGGGIDQSAVGSVVAYAIKLKSTTVGLRAGGQWTFHTLRYRRLNGGKSYEHHGLHQFVPMV